MQLLLVLFWEILPFYNSFFPDMVSPDFIEGDILRLPFDCSRHVQHLALFRSGYSLLNLVGKLLGFRDFKEIDVTGPLARSFDVDVAYVHESPEETAYRAGYVLDFR